MLPTLAQYKKWSLPAKYSFWSAVLAIVPMGITLKDWIVSVPEYAVLAFNYGTSEMTIYGAAGESPETAVIIRGANSHEAGVKAEYYWIRRRHPGYERLFQAVFDGPEPAPQPPRTYLKDDATGVEVEAVQPADLPPRRYDVLKIRSRYGCTRDVYFDITTFWGKKSEQRSGGLSEEDSTRQSFQRLQDAINQKMANPDKSGSSPQ